MISCCARIYNNAVHYYCEHHFFLLLAWVYGCVGVCEYPMCLLRSQRRSFEFLNEIYLYVHNIDIHSIGFDWLRLSSTILYYLYLMSSRHATDRRPTRRNGRRCRQVGNGIKRKWHHAMYNKYEMSLTFSRAMHSAN